MHDYCNAKFNIHNRSLAILYKHVVKAHPDILSEEEKKEDKFYWTWDYFIAKSDTEPTYILCNATIWSKLTSRLILHLKQCLM